MVEQFIIDHFETVNGTAIFRIPLEVFSGYYAFAHLIHHDGKLTLVDVGSGFGSSLPDLQAGLSQIETEYRIKASLEALHRIIITHGHVDHFGGLKQVKDIAVNARVAVHHLAKPVLVNYDERVLMSSKNVHALLLRAGVPEERRQRLMDMYMMGKRAYQSSPVDDVVDDGDVIDDVFQIIHVPGHAPGLIMILVDDILLTSDHVLPQTSVSLGPETVIPYTGVGHYLDSLQKALTVSGVTHALGGHEGPIGDYYALVERTIVNSRQKVERVLEECVSPKTIYEITRTIYGTLDGYGEMLRVWQTAARIEYLNQRGLVMVSNLDALETEDFPILLYKRV